MRLKKIILNGFKSFADKTDFDFQANITAIVGPNGCGKSNVVDAVKWVLGEQKKKSLRSSQMTDVIFSGSGSRKPSGMAEVSMIFSDVPGKGDERNELQITRRLYRNGDSTYLINGKSCRLRDIRELFMDTGVGVSAYSIIEQGQIAQLLNASKAERRVIFEEAAGISKFKAYKKEAARKLERTEQNLLRLADIVSEVQKQLRSVKLQAGKAKSYVEYRDRLNELRMSYSLAEYDKLTKKSALASQLQAALNDEYSSIVANVGKNDFLISELRTKIAEKEASINRNDNNLIAIKGKIDQQLERIDYLKKRIHELQDRKETASDRIHQIEEQNAKLEASLGACQYNLQQNEKLSQEKSAQLASLQDMLHEINLEYTTIQAQLEDEKSGVLDTVRRTAQLHNEIQSFGNYRENLSLQKERLLEKISRNKSQLEGMLVDKAGAQARKNDINSVIEELQTNLDTRKDQMEQMNFELSEKAEIMSSLKQKRSALESELKVLSNMEMNREGLNKAVKDILKAKNEGAAFSCVEGIVADIIRADAKYARAVEAFLDNKADSLIINSTSQFLADKQNFDLKGRLNVICLDRVTDHGSKADFSCHDYVLGNLFDLVNCEPEYESVVRSIFHNAFLIDTLDNAMGISREAGAGHIFVTLAGEVLENGYVLKVGKVGQSVGLISRKSRIHELNTELATLADQISQIEDFMEESNQQIDHMTQICKDLRTSIYEASTEKVDINTKLEVITQSIENLKREEPSMASEISNLEAQIDESVSREYESKQKLVELESVSSQKNSRIEELEIQLDEKKAVQTELSSQLTDIRIALGQTTVTRNAIKQEISSIQNQLQRSRMSIESARTDMLSSDEQVSQTTRGILNTEASVSELFVEKERAQIASLELKKDGAMLLSQLQEADMLVRQQRQSQSEIEKKIHETDLELNELRIKTEDLTQRVHEELELDIKAAHENYALEEMDWEAVRTEIDDLKNKIARLGNVNIDAIDELEELEKRELFLTEQVKDLQKSKHQLEQLIEKINTESREKFRSTFDEVRSNFKETFRKLFGGGKADVLLEDDQEDILECGIEIIAQPPGKSAKSITLLSGGEKTMTAIALQFAIFKSKPSPFCFLDEVDAALDEANNERFNLIVKEFESISQFIVISHSKRTMSIADVLFGVTMQQQGVSKRISVKFDREDSSVAVA